MKEVELIITSKAPGISKGPDVSFFFRTDTIQTMSDAGLKFSLRIKNNSADSVRLINILDFFNGSLLDNSGQNILFPHLSRVYLRPRDPYTIKSFAIDNVIINGEITSDKFAEKTHITIPAKANYEIFFRITNVQTSNAEKPYDFDKTIKIRKGIYQLFFSLAATRNSKEFTFYRLAPVYIHYKECSDI